VGYPNPEDTKAFALSEKLGADVGAEVLIATDPDADRMAVEVRDESGNYVSLNGNQTGVILIHYILEGLEAVGKLPEKGAMIKSIVTGDMGAAIGKAYGVEMFETLTGFKNICGKIPEIKKNGYQYVFGYEESIGYAVSEEVRDKDGISAAMFVCEAAAFYRKQGKTLLQVLQELYEKYGYYKEEQVSVVLEGIAGAKRIGRMMEAFRTAPLAEA
jgi:phosphoglucomutase